ncbi:MAG: hypothetical protein M3015_04675 [Bacteroidota bacterium]|nr:hypothetical protein [Bacteroidota bacterium]
MESEFTTLQTIFNIVKNDPHPETYLCSPREIILRQFQDWDTIQQHLQALEKEELIIIKQLDKIAICITFKGIAKAQSLLQSNQSLLAFSFSRA